MIKNNKTGSVWAKEFGLVMEDFRQGWTTMEEFERILLTRSEFFNRASVSKFKKPEFPSRQAAEKFKQNLLNKNNKPNK